jgi:hypothetical protein
MFDSCTLSAVQVALTLLVASGCRIGLSHRIIPIVVSSIVVRNKETWDFTTKMAQLWVSSSTCHSPLDPRRQVAWISQSAIRMTDTGAGKHFV